MKYENIEIKKIEIAKELIEGLRLYDNGQAPAWKDKSIYNLWHEIIESLDFFCAGKEIIDISINILRLMIDHDISRDDQFEEFLENNLQPPFYDADLIAWLENVNTATYYCDQAITQGCNENIITIIQYGWMLWRDEVALATLQAINDFVEKSIDS